MSTLSLELIDLPHSMIGEAVDVLAFAFENDPSLQYAFWANKPTYRDLLQEYFRFLCEVRYHLDWPVKGSLLKGKLVGVEVITPPEQREWTPKLHEIYESFKWYVGPVATERLEKFSELVRAHKPQEPHYFLSVIGVHPSVQGKGYAHALIDALHAMSEAHPESTGVYLDTANPVNVPKYEHLGYHTIATEQVSDVTVQYMFRPDSETEA